MCKTIAIKGEKINKSERGEHRDLRELRVGERNDVTTEHKHKVLKKILIKNSELWKLNYVKDTTFKKKSLNHGTEGKARLV